MRDNGSGFAAPESPAAWTRLAAAVLIGTVGCVGMWSVVVVLPAVQAEFGISRAGASIPYVATMVGLGIGGVVHGRLADRFGIVVPLLAGVVVMCVGYLGAAISGDVWQFSAAHVLVGLGSSATFAPLMADLSHWFTRRRGIAVAICSSGNYLAGVVWPPFIERFTATNGWRPTLAAVAIITITLILPLLLALRGRVATGGAGGAQARVSEQGRGLGLTPTQLHVLLCLAGVGCCVAMATPQVHIVAYCSDLGYGVARGAEMLSLMLALGIVSRVLSGFVADKIGGLAALLIGSVLQGLALVLYLGFNSLPSLYLISALFGLFQGGIVPMYAVIVREHFPANEAATRLGVVILMTLIGMALGGWLSGVIYDATGSYAYAFAHGIAWNVLNAGIALMLLMRERGPRLAAA